MKQNGSNVKMPKENLDSHFDEIIVIVTNALSAQGKINSSQRDIYLVSFYSSIVHYAESIFCLVSSNNFISIPPIFRSLLEAHIEFINLTKYEYYPHVLESIHLWQRIKKLEATYKEADNPYLRDTIEGFEDVGDEINKAREKKASVDKKIPELENDIKQIKTRFQLANLSDVYTGIYSQLCEDAHNGLLRIESRHLVVNDQKLKVSIKPVWNIEEITPHLLTTMDILESSVNKLFDYLDDPNTNNYQQRLKEKKKLFESFFNSYS